MSERTEAWIIEGVRTPRGRGKVGGGLAHLHPQRLMSQVLNELRERTNISVDQIDDVILGCGAGSGDHAADIARLSVLDAGWGDHAPGVTLNRYCGSGQQAVNFGAQAILSGHQDVVIAGGVESMSRYADTLAVGLESNNRHLFEQYPLVHQGVSADLLASLNEFTRQDVDEYAVLSQQRAAIAIEEGRFRRSIMPVLNDDGTVALDHDEHPRPLTTLEALSTLAPSFEAMGTIIEDGYDKTPDQYCLSVYPQLQTVRHVHHAGNSSGVVDGASGILMASSGYANSHGLTPRARVVMGSVVASEPVLMLSGPASAAQLCAKKAKMQLDDIDLFEVNEAFAAVVLTFLEKTGVDPAKVNVNGGGIALGHPIGATGPMLIQTVIDELERRNQTTGMVVMCTGGGMATATIVERVDA